jgi:hypothetical protein
MSGWSGCSTGASIALTLTGSSAPPSGATFALLSSPNPPWRHHYAPQLYLRQFTDREGLLWEYKREPSGRLTERRVTPKRTGFAKNLYSFRGNGPFFRRRPDLIETDFFRVLDNDAARVLRKILGGIGLPLSDEDRTIWALFLNSILERNVRVLRERDAQAPAIVEKILAPHRAKDPAFVEKVGRLADPLAMAQNAIREHMVNEIRRADVVNYFKGLKWDMVCLGPETELLTSDAPLVINGVERQGTRPIRMMTLALSPSRLLIMRPASWGELDDTFKRGLVLSHNLSLVQSDGNSLYSPNPIEDGEVVRLRKAVFEYFGRPTGTAPCQPTQSDGRSLRDQRR